MPEKPVFWDFLEISSFVFPDFLLKNANQQSSKHGRARFLRKIFFRSKIPEKCRKSPFLQIFLRLFPYISLFFFHTKNINDIAFFVYPFVRSLVRSFVRSFVHSFLRSFNRSLFRILSINVYICSQFSNFHYQVGPISMWLVFLLFDFYNTVFL